MSTSKFNTDDAFRLWCTDCILGLAQRVKSGTVPLIAGDPPYNQGEPYSDYDDAKPVIEYRTWMTKCWAAAANALSDTGTLVVFYPDEHAADMDCILRHELGLHRQSWIVWAYGFGVCCSKNFSRSHTHILRYTKHKTQFTFNVDDIRVPSNRALVYKDKRAANGGKAPDNTWALTREAMDKALAGADSDLWYQSRICGTFKERKSHSPNQIPEPIMDRIILSCSNPHDLVCDPFLGSGTTGVSAISHNRRFVGFDVSRQCVAESQKRIVTRLQSAQWAATSKPRRKGKR